MARSLELPDGRNVDLDYFVEWLLFWLRRNVRRGGCGYAQRYVGVRKDQIPLFRERFQAIRATRYRFLVWRILGRSTQTA